MLSVSWLIEREKSNRKWKKGRFSQLKESRTGRQSRIDDRNLKARERAVIRNSSAKRDTASHPSARETMGKLCHWVRARADTRKRDVRDDVIRQENIEKGQRKKTN